MRRSVVSLFESQAVRSLIRNEAIRLPHNATFGSMDRLVWAVLAYTATALAQPAETAADLAVRYLPELIRLDTTNPPGNETRVARYLKQVADREGIPAELLGDDP